MKYRKFIERYFLIDEPQAGKLVPFRFNKVQEKYYNELVELGIEKKGITLALREFIVKARREGFTSLILAIFAADDILQENPTETLVVSYKDDATGTFRKRYRRFILSYFAQKAGITRAQIAADASTLESVSKQAFSVDAADLELRHNRAHFYCGTASARTGGRGGVLQKLLFSEAAHYPDSENMTAAEIIEGTAQQVDKASGWIFQESTGNGKGNLFYRTYELITRGLSRYLLRFYGWREFYSPEQFQVIKSEFTDPDMCKQEYPESVDEAFLSTNLSFTNEKELRSLEGIEAGKSIAEIVDLPGVNYIDQCEIIKQTLITLCQTNPQRNFYAGIDTAKDIDRTVLTVLKDNELVANGGVKCIAIDATGAGDFMPDWFERNSKWYTLRVKFTRPSKSTMYKFLQVVLKEKLTRIPEIFDGPQAFVSDEMKRFYTQMLNLQKRVIGELIVVEHPAGKCKAEGHDYDNCVCHDDYPDSWALAEMGYTTINGMPIGKKLPDVGTNLDRSVRRMLDNSKGRRRGDAAEDFL